MSFANVNSKKSDCPYNVAICSFEVNPNARKRVVKGIFFERSSLTNNTSLLPISYSSQAPRVGMTCPKYLLLSVFLSMFSLKNTPALLTICDTITRSLPLMIKLPVGVIIGKSPMKIFCSLISPVSLFTSFTFTRKGLEKVTSFIFESVIVYFSSPNS